MSTASLTTAFMLFALVTLIRALPWPTELREQKPLSCHVCMAWWSGLIVTAIRGWWAGTLKDISFPAELAGVGLTIVLLYLLERMSPEAPPYDSTRGTLIEPPK